MYGQPFQGSRQAVVEDRRDIMDVRTTPLDMAAVEPHLHARLRTYVHKVDLRITSDDGMGSNDVHYLMVGASALDAILSAVRLGGGSDPARVLDFGSGAGRVTRWLKAAYPIARLCCCDLRSQDVAFCRDVFQADAWVSSTNVEELDFHGRYDLIWMGSVLTHVDEGVSRRLVARAMEALNPGGLLVATTIGRAARAVQDENPIFLEGPGWPTVKRGYDESGFGYVDYDGLQGYGLSLSNPAWATGLATRHSGRRLVMFSERLWDNLQDVFALQAEPSFKADPGVPTQLNHEANALRNRIDALESSTSWRMTSFLRYIVRSVR